MYDEAQAALRAGNFARYGQLNQQLDDLLQGRAVLRWRARHPPFAFAPLQQRCLEARRHEGGGYPPSGRVNDYLRGSPRTT